MVMRVELERFVLECTTCEERFSSLAIAKGHEEDCNDEYIVIPSGPDDEGPRCT